MHCHSWLERVGLVSVTDTEWAVTAGHGVGQRWEQRVGGGVGRGALAELSRPSNI